MKNLLFLLAIFYVIDCVGQEAGYTMYLYDEDPVINSDEKGILHYLINIESRDTIFNFDSYKFTIPNKIGFDKYKELKNMEEKVFLDSLDYVNIKNLSDTPPCELHNYLSARNKKFLIYKRHSEKYLCKSPDNLSWH